MEEKILRCQECKADIVDLGGDPMQKIRCPGCGINRWRSWWIEVPPYPPLRPSPGPFGGPGAGPCR